MADTPLGDRTVNAVNNVAEENKLEGALVPTHHRHTVAKIAPVWDQTFQPENATLKTVQVSAFSFKSYG